MKLTKIIEFFNKHYDDNNELIIKELTLYIHSRHRSCKRNIDGTESSWQPSWPDKIVQSYRVYYDNTMAYNHKSGRIILNFTDGTTDEIGLKRFKDYLRAVYQYRCFNP